jgi:transposase
MQAVKLRLDGMTVAQVCEHTGLSAPTVSASWKAFREGGWPAVPVRPRGRVRGQGTVLDTSLQQQLWSILQSPSPVGQPGWSSAALAALMNNQHSLALSKRAVEHWWQSQGLKHEPWPLTALAKRRSSQGRWYRHAVVPVLAYLPEAGQRWQGGVRRVVSEHGPLFQLYVHGLRGRLWMRCFVHPPQAQDYLCLFQALAGQGPASLVFHGALLVASPEISAWLSAQSQFWVVPVPADMGLGG